MYVALFCQFLEMNVFESFWTKSLDKNILLMLEFHKAQCLVIRFYFFIIMYFLIMISVILLSILMMLVSTLTVLKLLICGRKQLIDFDAGKTQLVLFDHSNTIGVIYVKISGSNRF